MTESTRLQNFWHDPSKKVLDERSRTIYWDICNQHFGPERPLDILEIGVFKGTLARLLTDQIKVKSYTGVDPYIGGFSSSYFGGYWWGQGGSDEIYESTKSLYDSRNFQLLRKMSHQFWTECNKTYDVIIVDGDHTLEIALWDMHHWFQLVRPGGLLMVDDYDNPDTPDVTRATNRFLQRNTQQIARTGYQHFEFLNANKVIPIGMSVVYAEKKEGATNQKHLDFKSRLTATSRIKRMAINSGRLAKRWVAPKR